MLAESNGALYAAIATAVIVSILSPMVAGYVSNRSKDKDAQIRHLERQQEIEGLRQAALDTKAEAKESADLARMEAKKNMADLAVAQAEQQSALLASNNKIVDATQQTTQEQVEIKRELVEVKELGVVTHALVNSDKTSGMHREIVALKAQRVALKGQLAMAAELAELKLMAGRPPSALASAATAALEEQVATLDLEIIALQAAVNDRLTQQYAAEAKVGGFLAPGPVTGEIPVTGSYPTDIHIENANITVAHEPDKDQS